MDAAGVAEDRLPYLLNEVASFHVDAGDYGPTPASEPGNPGIDRNRKDLTCAQTLKLPLLLTTSTQARSRQEASAHATSLT